MSPISKLLQKGISKQERQLGNPFFVYKGQKIPCAPSTVKSSRFMDAGGHLEDTQISLVVRKQLFLTVDDINITIDNSNFTVDSHGTILPNYDARRDTINAWVQARMALTADENDPLVMTIDNSCVAIDYDAPWPFDSFPSVDSVSITIDDDGRVTVDRYSKATESVQQYLPGIPGHSPVTIDASDLTIDHMDSTLTIDRHVTEIGYFDPIMLPDFRNLFLDLVDQDMERNKALINTSTDASLTIGTDAFDRPFRLPGVYQEDQGLGFGKRPVDGEIIEYQGKPYRIETEDDAGAYEAFYRLRLKSAYM